MLVALLGVLGVSAGFALGSSGPPMPTITSGPVSLTALTSASFSFTDSKKGVTFVCSLDGSSYSACSPPKAYGGLTQGTHTFYVQAKSTTGTSSPASYSWRVDLAPPSIAITFPLGGGSDNGSGWADGCETGGAGVCGTASDPSGVGWVAVSLRQNTTGKYWNGTSYQNSTETYFPAALSAQTAAGAKWFYALRLPSPDGAYTLHVVAADKLGNTTPPSSPSTSMFTIDTVAPPAASITSKPANPTNQTTASFSFTDSESGVSFVCRLDGGSYVSCSSPKSYSGLSQRAHTFDVEAVDGAGNISTATSYSWVVDTTPPPVPAITAHPQNPTTSTTASFSFTDTEAPVSFQCQLDSGLIAPCNIPTSYTGLSVGLHTFAVRALDTAGNVSAAATFSWTIQQTTGMPFTISGNAPAPLYPGAAAQPLPVKVTNPNTVTIYVTGLSATISATGTSGCSTSWFQIAQASIPSAGIAVPANGSVTLPAQGPTAPTIKMIDSGTNQDACRNTTLTLAYSGSAHS